MKKKRPYNDAAYQRQHYRDRLRAGECTYHGCPEKHRPDKVTCAKHATRAGRKAGA